MLRLILKILLRSWKELLIIGLLVATYHHIYELGVKQANIDNQVKIEAMQAKLDARVQEVIDLSSQASTKGEELTAATNKQLDIILNLSKNKSMTIIKDGKCIPSEDFKKVYFDLINEANSK